MLLTVHSYNKYMNKPGVHIDTSAVGYMVEHRSDNLVTKAFSE